MRMDCRLLPPGPNASWSIMTLRLASAAPAEHDRARPKTRQKTDRWRIGQPSMGYAKEALDGLLMLAVGPSQSSGATADRRAISVRPKRRWLQKPPQGGLVFRPAVRAPFPRRSPRR